MNHRMDSHVKKILVQSAQRVKLAAWMKKAPHIYKAKSKHTELERFASKLCVLKPRAHPFPTHTYSRLLVGCLRQFER